VTLNIQTLKFMTHKSIVQACENLGLKVSQVPASNRRAYEAVGPTPGVRVYWTTSYEGGVLGLPRVITRDGHDTHARTTKEIAYLVKV
jgi:hypothetical protein